MKPVWTGIKYAIVCNLIIVLVPITVGLLDIAQSSRPAFHTFIESGYHDLAGTLICYSILGCPEKLAYLIFVVGWIIFSGIMYFIAVRRAYIVPDRRKFLSGSVIAFPFANHLMIYPTGIILFITETLKFGFV